MSLPDSIRKKIVLPAFCAPMFIVSSPELVREACLAGIIGGLPRHNARSVEQFEQWLKMISAAREQAAAEGKPSGVLAVNVASQGDSKAMQENLELCARYGVEIIVNAMGDPAEITKRSHDLGLLLYADAVNLRFAEKAVAAGVDGITAIGAGGGGHSGTVSHLALIPKVREIFDGTIVMAGCISNGAGIRAAETLGADLAYLGTRFIATKESYAPEAYHDLLVSQTAKDLIYTPKVSGVPANWMKESMRQRGIDPDSLPEGDNSKKHSSAHIKEKATPWVNLWSAGQGIELIHDIPAVAELVDRLKSEYSAAVDIPPFKGF